MRRSRLPQINSCCAIMAGRRPRVTRMRPNRRAASTVTVTCPSASQVYTGAAQVPCTAEAAGVGLSAVDVTTLLPESHAYFAFMGSLTTPPCSEGVLWLVMKTPVTVSSQQVAVFSKLYKMNARPIQAANGRLIKESL